MSNTLDIERMTIHEFNLRMLANKLKRIDKEYYMHLQAFLNLQIQGTDKKGNLAYKKFEQFYDYEKEQNKVLGIKTESKIDSKIVELIKIANK